MSDYGKPVRGYRVTERDAQYDFECELEKLLKKNLKNHQRIVIVCIGSDLMVGDCVGPLVGHKLVHSHYGGITVYGKLGQLIGVHNLKETIQEINYKYKNPLIIAVDSTLVPDPDNIGLVGLTEGGIIPGSGFYEETLEIGHISITGTTSAGNISKEKFAQSVSLNLVMQLSDFIANCLLNVLDRIDLTVRV